jgi:hypothetical protein
MLREEANQVIDYLKEGGYLTEELQSLIEGGTIIDEDNLVMYPVKCYEDIKEFINDYTVYTITETFSEEEKKGYKFAFRSELPEGGYIFKDLLVSGDGGLYVSDIY